MKQVLYYTTLFSLLLPFGSCRKFVEVPSPDQQVLSDQVFTTESRAASAVTAIYGSMINGIPGFSNQLTTLYGGLSADELDRYNPSAVLQEFLLNELTAANRGVRNLWSTAYKHIYYANAVAEGLSRATQLDAATRAPLLGECRFIRAFAHFYLVNFFGPVPLVTTTDYSQNAALSRKATADVYAAVRSDLDAARRSLPRSYTDGHKARPTYWAATALLARVRLYEGAWAGAESLAAEVLASGLFTPLPPLQSAFLKNSKEAVWQLAPTSGALPETRQMRPSGTTPQVYLTRALLDAFEPADQRRVVWIDSVWFENVRYHFPAKYKNTTTQVTEYYMVLRAAEQYLIRAEARARQNKLPDALGDLNAVRARAGLPPLPPTRDRDALLAAVEKERRLELAFEWAHRWLDLKRSGRADAVLAPLKRNWQGTDALYPIPEDERQLNASLTQNPGY